MKFKQPLNKNMRKQYIFLILLIAIYILLQLCLAMRTSDTSAIRTFRNKGLTLTTRTLQIKGRHMHYVSIGSDTMRTIVFVHGSPGSWTAFEKYLQDPTLRSRFRLISIDRPGFGHSDYGDALPLQQECDLISSLLDSIQNGKSIFLVGHSFGGTIVPVLAAEHPDHISGIVVLAGALDPALEPVEGWRHMMTRIPFRYLLPGAFRPSNDELWYFKKDIFSIKDKLPLIKCRAYIMHAQNDMIVDVGNVAYMKQHFTSAQVTDTIFPSGNHFIPWNHADYIIKVLSDL
jgi:pimeloyl-ACP methyl ester carboxylesterase